MHASLQNYNYLKAGLSMTKIIGIFVLLLCLSVSGFAQQSSFKTVNIMDDFWRFWEKAEKLEPLEQAKMMRTMVIDPHKQVFKDFTGDYTDEQYAQYMKLIKPYIPEMKKISLKLSDELPKHEAEFRKTFPDMKWEGTVVFFINFGATDSGTGSSQGRQHLVFGVDSIASTYPPGANLSVLFAHELFHLYHQQFGDPGPPKNRSKGEIPLYSLIWGEGLATYISMRLNPNATTPEIFLNSPVAADSEKILPRLLKEVRENFDSGAEEVWGPFMAAENNSKGIPPRAGYYIGYLIAKELGKKMSMRQLAILKGDDLKKRVMKVLIKLEKQASSGK